MTIDDLSKYKIRVEDDYVKFKHKRIGRDAEAIIEGGRVVYRVNLSDNAGKQKFYSYAKLSAELFVPNPDNLPNVGFKDFDVTNCKLSNLFWTTKELDISRYLEDREGLLKKIRVEFNIPNKVELKFHPFEPRYICSELGDIFYVYYYFRGILYPKAAKCSLSNDRHGYLRTGINGKVTSAHRLIAETFLPNPENKPQVNHKNGIKTDNRVENLEWVTPKENTAHAIETGLIKRSGEDCYKALLTNEQVIEICRDIIAGKNNSELVKRYNVSEAIVSVIRGRHNWKHITESDEFKDVIFPKSKRDRKHSDETIRNIRLLSKRGWTNRAIVDFYNEAGVELTIELVYAIVKDKIYQDVK